MNGLLMSCLIVARADLLRLLTAAFDAVDGSSTGTRVPWMWHIATIRCDALIGALSAA